MTNEQLLYTLSGIICRIEKALEEADAKLGTGEVIRHVEQVLIAPVYNVGSESNNPDDWEDQETTAVALDPIREVLKELKHGRDTLKPQL